MCVNGYTSAAFFPSRGVRQGCPLSPLLYVLSIEVLAANLRVARLLLVYDYHMFPPLYLSSPYMQMTQLSLLFLIQRFLRFSKYTHASKLALVLSSTWASVKVCVFFFLNFINTFIPRTLTQLTRIPLQIVFTSTVTTYHTFFFYKPQLEIMTVFLNYLHY